MKPCSLLLLGDARFLPLRDQSVHCVVTSPPYWGLRDYGLPPLVWDDAGGCEHEGQNHQTPISAGQNHFPATYTLTGGRNPRDPLTDYKSHHATCLRCSAWSGSLGLEPTPELYVQHLVKIFREVRRVLRDDGTAWLNLGDAYAGSWGNYAPGGIKGTQRPQTEAGKRLDRPAYADTTFLPPNASVPGLKPKDLIGLPWRVAFALQADGWWLRSDIIWSKPNPMPESVTDRPTKSHEYLFLLAKSERYYYDAEAIKEPLESSSILRLRQKTFDRQTGGPKDYAGGVNDNRSARRALVNLKGKAMPPQGGDSPAQWAALTGRNKRTVWEIPTAPFPDAHFATFPRALVTPCILAGSAEGGIVLDPFSGSGTTVLVAKELGRVGIGVDLKREYISMAQKRTRQGVLL